MEAKNTKEIILNCEKLERRVALLSDGRLEEYKIEHDTDEPKVGDIYLGRISNLDPALQAAFVDIGAPKKAFLHYITCLLFGFLGFVFEFSSFWPLGSS